jgi:hypothetical protein
MDTYSYNKDRELELFPNNRSFSSFNPGIILNKPSGPFRFLYNEILPKSFVRRINKALRELHETHLYFGKGNERIVFIKYPDAEEVIKIPLKEAGLAANYREERLYQSVGKDGSEEYAKCRIEDDFLLVMERLHYSEHLPEWADFVDCQQVGVDKRGTFKVFDFG